MSWNQSYQELLVNHRHIDNGLSGEHKLSANPYQSQLAISDYLDHLD
ncbi:Protein of unknown function [Lactobacillus helveticus CIRM-BIA 101]|nr:Protein of unknown function [Lactobacillus helveticus CIRM-BIA 101]